MGGPPRPCDDQPASTYWQPLLTQRHPLAGTRILDRPLGPFRGLPAIPARGWQVRRHRCHGARGGLCVHHPPL